MRLLLVAPPIMDYVGHRIRPLAHDATHKCLPYGLYLLASILRDNGHHVTVLELIASGNNQILQFQTLFLDADLVGLTATSLSWPTVLDVIWQIRKVDMRVPIVWGGIQLIAFPNEGALRKQLGVSRTVVREAVKVLADKGMVQVRPRSGTRGWPRSDWNQLDPDILVWLSELKPEPLFLREVCEVRLGIEPIASGFEV